MSLTNSILSHMLPMFVVAAAIVTLQSCDDKADVPVETTPQESIDSTLVGCRTVLVYMAGENSLSSFVEEDLTEMLEGMDNASLPEGCKLLIYVDDPKLPRIYSVTKETKQTTFSNLTAETTYSSDHNSASAQQLAEVIDYMLAHHPAETYGLVMWSHASGWIPSTYSGDAKQKSTQTSRSFGIDNGRNLYYSNNGNQMNIPEMAEAIAGRCQFEFIFFDACFMQCVEVAYELRNCARYIIASPAEIPGPGADYSTMVKAMFKEKDLAHNIVNTYYNTYYDSENNTYRYVDFTQYGTIISAVDESKIDGFAAYMKALCDKHRDELLGIKPSDVLRYFDYNLYSNSAKPDFMDMKGIMKETLRGVEYSEWLAEFDKVVVANKFTPKWTSIFSLNTTVIPEQCGGMSMFIPLSQRYTKREGNYVESIKTLQWGQLMWGDENSGSTTESQDVTENEANADEVKNEVNADEVGSVDVQDTVEADSLPAETDTKLTFHPADPDGTRIK